MDCNQDIIQINNNSKITAMTEKQCMFSKISENSRSSGQSKWQNLPMVRFILPNKMPKTVIMLQNRK